MPFACGNCMMPDSWDGFTAPPVPGSNPNTPRNGCRPGVCVNNRMGYQPNYPKNTPRSGRGRNFPWGQGFGGDERLKGQRCRNGSGPYW